jgi:uncharacterized protein (TIGR04255 family)
MPFPAIERVIYKKNLLNEVVFQARFPRFLPIEAEPPSEFQKLVIGDYPIYEQRNVIQIILGSGQENLPPASEIQGRMHAFLSRDKVWTVILSGDIISLSTRVYIHWEDCKVRLQKALEAFFRIYRLAFFTRLGLRYQDVIRPQELGLEGKPWSSTLSKTAFRAFSAWAR